MASLASFLSDIEGAVTDGVIDSRQLVKEGSYWIIHVELELMNADKTYARVEPTEVLFKTKLTANYRAIHYVTAKKGVNGKVRDSSITYITTGKNIGKKNETNVLHQVLIDARSKYNKQVRNYNESAGANTTASNAASNGASNTTGNNNSCSNQPDSVINNQSQGPSDGVHPRAVHPQLISNYRKKTDVIKDKHAYYLEPKLNGCTMLTTYDDTLGGALCWKRTLKTANLQPHLQKECDLLTSYFPDKFHGEFYKPGVSINVTAGIYNHKTFDGSMPLMEFHVFDIADPDMKQKDRIKRKEKIFNDPRVIALKYIKQVKSTKYTTTEAMEVFYQKALADGYEGIVIRDADAKYRHCVKNYHVSHAFKYKPIYDREFECIDFAKCDNGKSVGCVKYICRIPPDGEFGERTFTIRPKGITEPESKAEYIRLQEVESNGKTVFENHFKGVPYQVEFDEYSDEGKPLKAYGLRFRPTAD